MKIWIDDIRQAPPGYEWAKSVNEAKRLIEKQEAVVDKLKKSGAFGVAIFKKIEFIDMDHDAGDYANDGGDYIKLLDWLEETNRNYPIRIHSMNPVGVQNMRNIIQKNNWKEI